MTYYGFKKKPSRYEWSLDGVNWNSTTSSVVHHRFTAERQKEILQGSVLQSKDGKYYRKRPPQQGTGGDGSETEANS